MSALHPDRLLQPGCQYLVKKKWNALSRQTFIHFYIVLDEGVLLEQLGWGTCNPLPKTIALFIAKESPVYDLTKHLIPYIRTGH